MEHWDKTFPKFENERTVAEQNAKKLLTEWADLERKKSTRGLRQHFIENEKGRLQPKQK